MTKSRDRLPDGLNPLKHSLEVLPSVAIAGERKLMAFRRLPRLAEQLSTPPTHRVGDQ
jgi:hypothetical protein